MATTPISLIGAFEVLAELGQGASSSLLKIRRKADGKTYALKVITVHEKDDHRFVEQAQREFEVGSQLDHQSLTRIHAFEKIRKLFRVTGARLLVEFVDGLPLDQCRGLPVGKLVRIFARAASGLAHMHEKGFCHADVKPANLMVTRDGKVKVIDFGLAWRKGERKDRVQGTLEFLAPEQATQKVVNVRTDIFNLGATMYRALTGHPVPSELRQASKNGDSDSLVRPLTAINPAVPSPLDELVRQCLTIDPQSRPKSMLEVRNRLRQLAKEPDQND